MSVLALVPNVWLARAAVPLPCRAPTVSFPPSVSWPSSCSAGCAARRCAAPRDRLAPACTSTEVACVLPSSWAVPVTTSVPAPRLAVTSALVCNSVLLAFRVRLPPPSVPAKVRLPTVSVSLSVSVALRSTVTAALSDNRSALLSVSVPLLTCTVPAAAVPLSVLLPWLVSVPAPNWAVASVLPPSSVYCAATSVPVPASVPASARLATVSVPSSSSDLPLSTVTAAVLDRRSSPTSVNTPPLTCTVLVPAVPDNLALPPTLSVPVPRLALISAPPCKV